ncbi:unnamed protein product, partial [Mesorhabditis belari]|uniref:serine--tRNA ligase n=1 Tax=Mesorhabditis belari TaxID=2138241 RepID=A0AAF3J9Z7_9BILA
MKKLQLIRRISQARCHFSSLRPNLDFDYLLNPDLKQEIEQNIKSRKGVGDIDVLYSTWKRIESLTQDVEKKEPITEEQFQKLWDKLYEEALNIPNTSHPTAPLGDESNCEIVEEWGEKSSLKKPKLMERLVQAWRTLLYSSDACGERSYFLMDSLARLEKALLEYAYDRVLENGFAPVIVSDLVPTQVTRACGVQQKEGAHAIQYLLTDEPDTALSGTAEMGIAAMLQNRKFKKSELPLRLVSQSRCFRPEISRSAAEAKLYRVHEFYKVEMFVVCTPEQSEKQLKRLVDIQKNIFKGLEIHARLKNMSTEELGASAHQKFDIEAWMPGRELWGEVSSASNCTDYQARRLNIQYITEKGELLPVHTCNGTAIASTRALITVLETHQTQKGGINLPKVLQERLGKPEPHRLKFQRAAPLS